MANRSDDRRRRLRAIKRYLAARDDRLPWLFISERLAQLTRQAVN
jgi:type 1 fimbriae regulatory protein FimB